MKVDIAPLPAAGALKPGQYILKLALPAKWEGQETEATCHSRAQARNASFASARIPSLVRSYTHPDNALGTAILYEAAGRRLDSYVATDVRESPQFYEICGSVATDLLESWVDASPEPDLTDGALLNSWLGYRLDRKEAPAVHRFAEALAGGSRKRLVIRGDVVPDPLAFCEFASAYPGSERPVLLALEHGDLHGGNVLASSWKTSEPDYWLVDFALSSIKPAGFDLAYLELAHVLYCLGDSDPTLVIETLRHVDAQDGKLLVPPTTLWLIQTIRKIRAAIGEWICTRHSRRMGDVERQFALARVAVGINWANKPVSDAWKRLALYYGGWAARSYLEGSPVERDRFWAWAGGLDTTAVAVPPPSAADEALWEELWKATKGFSATTRVVIVAQAQRGLSDMAALGHLPLSVVIDLDPLSEEEGLYHASAPVLESRRSVRVSSADFGPLDFSRATAWLMSSGWLLRSEGPTDFPSWKYKKLPAIRALARTLEEQTNPDPLVVISLAGGSLDESMPLARLEFVLDALDEASAGRAQIFHIGPAPCSKAVRHTYLPMDLSFFFSRLARSFGSTGDTSVPDLPGKGGTRRPLSLGLLRAMEENFHVLHSRILDTPVTAEATDDAFWRGNPPTWLDLHSGLDIRREISNDLLASLREALEEARNRTVLLYHRPGSGGTTAALRAAWDLHREVPTAILRRTSPALADRLQDLYNCTEMPVLLVADAGLRESARQELYVELQKRHVRVVLFYLRRVFQPPSEGLVLEDPMSSPEAERFNAAYMDRTTDPARREELLRITRDEALARYRTPFFYGLTAFDRDFRGTGAYVSHHLSEVWGKHRKLFEHLALVTIYSNTGLHEVFLRRMLDLSDSSLITIDQLIGAGPARLTIRRNGLYRLMHSVIAEQVLEHLDGPRWRLELKTLTIDFINDLARYGGQHSRGVIDLLRQMVIDRQGGEVDDVEDRQRFSPLIEMVDTTDASLGHLILTELTVKFPSEAHFFNHLGRHQIYRVKRDFDKAEESLLQAIRLSPNDFIHHSTLGLVRKHRVRQLLSSNKSTNAEEVIGQISALFQGAVDAFQRTRELSQDNIYAYITHAQLILEVVAKLKIASAVGTIAQIPEGAQDWVQGQVSVASALIDAASELYGTLEKSETVLTSCVADLEKLYGNIDDAILIWELAHERTGGSANSRRALSNAYLSRGRHRWSALSEPELRRIVGLMDLNLRQSGRRDDDYRLWFEAFKLLPEFDADEAIGRVRIWSERFPSWRAYYYTYVLHFCLWFLGRTESTDALEANLDRCQAIAFGRRNISHNWLGHFPDMCPLIAAADLGEWDAAQNFWKSAKGLRRVNGFTEVIHGPQAGTILINNKVRAFFVPGKELSANRGENQKVNFFLGFSASGLRAWSYALGWVEEGFRVNPKAVAPPLFQSHETGTTETVKANRAAQIQLDSVRVFIRDLIAAKRSLGIVLTVHQLAEKVDAVFGVDGFAATLGQDHRAFLNDLEGITVVGDGIDALVQDDGAPTDSLPSSSRRMDGRVFQLGNSGLLIDSAGKARVFNGNLVRRGNWKSLTAGAYVTFIPSRGKLGRLEASDVLFEKSGDVRELLRMWAGELAKRSATSPQPFFKRSLITQMEELFGGVIPGLSNPDLEIESIVLGLDGLTLAGKGSKRLILVNETPAVGRRVVSGETAAKVGTDEQGPSERSAHHSKPSTVAPSTAVAVPSTHPAWHEALRGIPDRLSTDTRDGLSVKDLAIELKNQVGLQIAHAMELTEGSLAERLKGAPGVTLSLRGGRWFAQRSTGTEPRVNLRGASDEGTLARPKPAVGKRKPVHSKTADSAMPAVSSTHPAWRDALRGIPLRLSTETREALSVEDLAIELRNRVGPKTAQSMQLTEGSLADKLNRTPGVTLSLRGGRWFAQRDSSAEALVLSLLRESPEGTLSLPDLGGKLRKAFPKGRDLAANLGMPLLQFLRERVHGIETTGDGRFVRHKVGK
ncbi:MAG: hypothetical protein ABI672_05925 [Vicinamibacteria bacterium]